MSSILRLAPSHFFGKARLSCSGPGIEVSHRIAEGFPESVLTHTHEDAHFILVTGGEYVTAASGSAAHVGPILIYNPPGTTHRDHFERGRGSFFAISVAPATARAALSDLAAPTEPQRLVHPPAYALTIAIAQLCRLHGCALALESLTLELLVTLHANSRRESRAHPHGSMSRYR